MLKTLLRASLVLLAFTTVACAEPMKVTLLGTGVPTQDDVVTPQQLGTFAGWTAVSAGWAQSCGVYQGQVYCWGMNGDGEIGIGMPYDHEVRTPTRIGIEL